MKFEDIQCHRAEINQQDKDTRQKKGGNERIVNGHIKPVGIVGVFHMFA